MTTKKCVGGDAFYTTLVCLYGLIIYPYFFAPKSDRLGRILVEQEMMTTTRAVGKTTPTSIFVTVFTRCFFFYYFHFLSLIKNDIVLFSVYHKEKIKSNYFTRE